MPSSQQDHDRSIARLLLEPYTTTPADAALYFKPTTRPTNAVEGDIYLDSTTHLLTVYNGTSWQQSQGGQRPVKTAAATLVAADAGALCIFNTAAGQLYTLPTPVAGLWFEFVVQTTATSLVHRVACSVGAFLLGTILQSTDGTYTVAARTANGSTHLAWEGDGSTTGGIIGDHFWVTALSTTQWEIYGTNSATNTEATPFKTT
jgi:hypothetical protein